MLLSAMQEKTWTWCPRSWRVHDNLLVRFILLPEKFVLKSIGCARTSRRAQLDKTVVDDSGQCHWSTISGHWSANDECFTVNIHPDTLAFYVRKVNPCPNVFESVCQNYHTNFFFADSSYQQTRWWTKMLWLCGDSSWRSSRRFVTSGCSIRWWRHSRWLNNCDDSAEILDDVWWVPQYVDCLVTVLLLFTELTLVITFHTFPEEMELELVATSPWWSYLLIRWRDWILDVTSVDGAYFVEMISASLNGISKINGNIILHSIRQLWRSLSLVISNISEQRYHVRLLHWSRRDPLRNDILDTMSCHYEKVSLQ